MEKVKIYSVVSNSNNETTTIEALADYDSEACTLKYMEENLSVTIEIFEKRIRMERKNDLKEGSMLLNRVHAASILCKNGINERNIIVNQLK